MNIDRFEVLHSICYTKLVYERINNKLNTVLSNSAIEKMVFEIISKTELCCFERIGKNIYVSNSEIDIRITINSNTFRIITIDRLSKMAKRKF